MHQDDGHRIADQYVLVKDSKVALGTGDPARGDGGKPGGPVTVVHHQADNGLSVTDVHRPDGPGNLGCTLRSVDLGLWHIWVPFVDRGNFVELIFSGFHVRKGFK